MSDLKKIKNRVLEEWQNAMPGLTMYAKNKLYKRCGPIVMGIELIKLPWVEEYRPHFVVYPLWKSSLKECLDVPIILNEYYNVKGFQFSIPFERHNSYFRDVVEKIKEQTPVLFSEHLSSGIISTLIDEYSKNSHVSRAPNSYHQALLQQAKLELALYFNVEDAQHILGQIKKKIWDVDHFNGCGIDITQWIEELRSKLNNRNNFIAQVETNKRKIGIINAIELNG